MTFHGPGGEIDQLARGLETLDTTLDGLCGALRGLNVHDLGPREASQSFATAVQQLERGLGQIGAQARDAAVVVRRFDSEEDA